jgi:predicted pyridoxine 5'-phosphate oxidase superfamily flavin-nucleotide-binding protein
MMSDSPVGLVRPSSDVAFSPAVKRVQQQRGSRDAYARREEKGGFRTEITPDLAEFLGQATSFYLASASAEGQPYVQHRGGPPGFLVVANERTLAFADFKGNRQYITTGNLSENPRAQIFVMDYASRQRVKIAKLFPAGYNARPEQAIIFEIDAWDSNCNQHIPQMFKAEDVAGTIRQFQERMRELEVDNAALKARIAELEKARGGG